MAIYDLHSSNFAVDGMVGIASSAGWGSPPINNYSLRYRTLPYSVGDHQADSSYGAEKNASIRSFFTKLFHKQHSRKKSNAEKEKEENSNEEGNNETVAPSECPFAVINQTLGEDGELLFTVDEIEEFVAEKHSMDEKTVEDEQPTSEHEQGCEHNEEELYPGEESLVVQGPRLKRIKFADEEGLEMETIFEIEPVELEKTEDSEETSSQKAQKSFERRLRKAMQNKSPPKDYSNSFKRYYSSYTDDYECKRINAAGALSIVTF